MDDELGYVSVYVLTWVVHMYSFYVPELQYNASLIFGINSTKINYMLLSSLSFFLLLLLIFEILLVYCI